jgi:hypothetical protein
MGVEYEITVGVAVGIGVAAAHADKKTEISPVNRTRRFILPPLQCNTPAGIVGSTLQGGKNVDK